MYLCCLHSESNHALTSYFRLLTTSFQYKDCGIGYAENLVLKTIDSEKNDWQPDLSSKY